METFRSLFPPVLIRIVRQTAVRILIMSHRLKNYPQNTGKKVNRHLRQDRRCPHIITAPHSLVYRNVLRFRPIISPVSMLYDWSPSQTVSLSKSTTPHQWNAMVFLKGLVPILNAKLYVPKYSKSSKVYRDDVTEGCHSICQARYPKRSNWDRPCTWHYLQAWHHG